MILNYLFNSKKLLLTCLASSIILSGCDQSPFGKGSIKCNDADAIKTANEIIDKSMNTYASTRIKEMIETENVTLDMGKVRSTLKQLSIGIVDIRTSNSDPNSKKEYCVAQLSIKVPSQVVEAANASRSLYDETSVEQDAILNDLTYELNEIKYEIEYMVQPTDDGKKVYVSIENSDMPTRFATNIAIDSMLKTARQSAIQQAEQEAAAREAEASAAEEEYAQLRLNEAQASLDNANKNINLVWNAASKETREYLLDGQKIWLKKRELECKLEGNNAEYGEEEIVRLNCEANKTNYRTQELKSMVYQFENY